MANSYVATIPAEAGAVVGIAVWDGRLIIACENGVYTLKDGYCAKAETLALCSSVFDRLVYKMPR